MKVLKQRDRSSTRSIGAQLYLHFEVRIDNTCVDPELYLKGVKTLEKELTMAEAVSIVKDKASLDDKTIDYLANDYKYGKDLIIELAKAML